MDMINAIEQNEKLQSFAEAIRWIDEYLDDNVSKIYKDQPLAQDWARVSKGVEETGESIAELILMTGQNPRKPATNDLDKLLGELADAALTNIYAMQHFTKDINLTWNTLIKKAHYHKSRLQGHAV